MAFKPITKTKEIKGVQYTAQFNGMSALFDAKAETEGNDRKMLDYLFANVLVEPKIDDMDDYFGTDINLMNEVVTFASKVMSADSEYFPENKESGTKTTSKK